MTEDHTPTKVRAKEKIEIDFKKEPDSRTVEVWTSETKSETVRLENGSFAAPEEKGVYVCHIFSWWKQGDGNYAFSIEVE